jgi:hypothetical protein
VPLPLVVQPEQLWMHRVDPDASTFDWLAAATWSATMRTRDELTVVCDVADVAAATATTGPYRAFKVDAVLDHDVIGILAGIAGPLAEAGISIFSVSTFDTDYTLVPEARLHEAIDALQLAAYPITHA